MVYLEEEILVSNLMKKIKRLNKKVFLIGKINK
ncbi:Conserved hypothetical protein [Prochlorococcus marinus str. NATL2A]|uniref:Uncharacterized protein n=2 Tax=Prochlorococcus marinus TaxID=1219 RepID=A7ME15_PROMT|nr:Hypothetical protein NATL1_21231 [Prochlorococcus marinus str. NATL1A]ABU24103.1 Conserved hypothetical protein [Prochlorococcus marinus str. NATL2A]